MGISIDVISPSGNIEAYTAKPDIKARGGVIVIHEVWGLNSHTKDIADRLAAEGFVALAPELLVETIDTHAAGLLQQDLFNPEKRNEVQPKLREITSPMYSPEFATATLARVQSCFGYLYALPDTHEKIAIMGFCFGGSYSFSLAVHEPRLKLALPFYGHADFSVDELKQIKCPIRAFYGENDARLMKSLPDITTKMKQAGVDFDAKVYPNAGHAFFNDTNKFAYNESSATDAWQLTLEYLKTFVG